MRSLLLLPLLWLACAPDLGTRDSLVTGTEVLTVRGEPPEVGAGQSAHFDLLVASPGGTVAPAALWGICTSPESLSDDEIVSSACVQGGGTQTVASGPSVDAMVPGNACSLFGPDPPPGGYRPRSPDTTGGYYQPIRAQVPHAGVAFGLERLTCDLANAPAAIAHQYATTYTLNRNPKLLPLTATVDGSTVALGAIPGGRHVVFEAAWNASSAETYVVFDLASQTLVSQREALRVSWYATDGVFDSDKTGRDSGDHATTTDDGWTAPSGATTVHLWIVLRDSRGGIDFASEEVHVTQ